MRRTRYNRLSAPALGLAIVFGALFSSVGVGFTPRPVEPVPPSAFRPIHLSSDPDSPTRTSASPVPLIYDFPSYQHPSVLPLRATPSAKPAVTVKPKPKPKPVVRVTPAGASHSASGVPTWYCWSGRSRCTYKHPDIAGHQDMYAAAGPSLRVGNWRGRLVTVCAKWCIRVRLIDWCACGGAHFIDLYHDAWIALGSPRRATVRW